VPLGTPTSPIRLPIDTLRKYLEIYYALPVRVAEPADLEGARSREQQWGARKWRQYLTGDILTKILRPRVTPETFCLLGVTMEDLYPSEDWNYVFGQASLADRVGVYSLVRFGPEFWGEAETPETERLGRLRSLKTLVHETGHMLGVHHCQTYECVMNGSNSLAEADQRPMHLCPECLKKFRWNTGFDIMTRYENLKTFYTEQGLEDEAQWVAQRLRECGATSPEADTGKSVPKRGCGDPRRG